MTLCISPSFYFTCSFFTVVVTVFIILFHFITVYQGAFQYWIELGDHMLHLLRFHRLRLLILFLGHLVLTHWVSGQFYDILVILPLIAPKFKFDCFHLKCLLSLVILTGKMTALTKNVSN